MKRTRRKSCHDSKERMGIERRKMKRKTRTKRRRKMRKTSMGNGQASGDASRIDPQTTRTAFSSDHVGIEAGKAGTVEVHGTACSVSNKDQPCTKRAISYGSSPER